MTNLVINSLCVLLIIGFIGTALWVVASDDLDFPDL